MLNSSAADRAYSMQPHSAPATFASLALCNSTSFNAPVKLASYEENRKDAGNSKLNPELHACKEGAKQTNLSQPLCPYTATTHLDIVRLAEQQMGASVLKISRLCIPAFHSSSSTCNLNQVVPNQDKTSHFVPAYSAQNQVMQNQATINSSKASVPKALIKQTDAKVNLAPPLLTPNPKSQLVYTTLHSNLNHKGLSLTRVQLVNDTQKHKAQPNEHQLDESQLSETPQISTSHLNKIDVYVVADVKADAGKIAKLNTIKAEADSGADNANAHPYVYADTKVEICNEADINASKSTTVAPEKTNWTENTGLVDSLTAEGAALSDSVDANISLKRQQLSYLAQQRAEARYQHALQEQLKANCCLTHIDCIDDELLGIPDYISSELSDSPISEPPVEDYNALEWEWNEDAVIDLIYSQDNEIDYAREDDLEEQLEKTPCLESELATGPCRLLPLLKPASTLLYASVICIKLSSKSVLKPHLLPLQSSSVPYLTTTPVLALTYQPLPYSSTKLTTQQTKHLSTHIALPTTQDVSANNDESQDTEKAAPVTYDASQATNIHPTTKQNKDALCNGSARLDNTLSLSTSDFVLIPVPHTVQIINKENYNGSMPYAAVPKFNQPTSVTPSKEITHSRLTATQTALAPQATVCKSGNAVSGSSLPALTLATPCLDPQTNFIPVISHGSYVVCFVPTNSRVMSLQALLKEPLLLIHKEPRLVTSQAQVLEKHNAVDKQNTVHQKSILDSSQSFQSKAQSSLQKTALKPLCRADLSGFYGVSELPVSHSVLSLHTLFAASAHLALASSSLFISNSHKQVQELLQPNLPFDRHGQGFTCNRVFDFLIQSIPEQSELCIQPAALASQRLTLAPCPKASVVDHDLKLTAHLSCQTIPTSVPFSESQGRASQPTDSFNHALSSCRYHAAVTDAEQYSPDFCSCSASNLEPPLPLNTTDNAELHFVPDVRPPKTVSAVCPNHPSVPCKRHFSNQSLLNKAQEVITDQEPSVQNLQAAQSILPTPASQTANTKHAGSQSVPASQAVRTPLYAESQSSVRTDVPHNFRNSSHLSTSTLRTKTQHETLVCPTNHLAKQVKTEHRDSTGHRDANEHRDTTKHNDNTEHRDAHASTPQFVVLDLHTWAASTKSHTICSLKAPDYTQDQWQPVIKNALRKQGQLIISAQGAEFTLAFWPTPIPTFQNSFALDKPKPMSMTLHPLTSPTMVTSATLTTTASPALSSDLAAVPSKISTAMTNLTHSWNLFKKSSSSKSSPLFGMHRQNLVIHALRHQLLYMCLSLGGLGIGLLSLGALIYKSNQSNLIPYVVTVDSHGVVLNQGQALPQAQIPKTVVTSQLCNFVRNLRMLSQDKEVQQQAILNAYAFVRPDSELIKQMNEYYSTHNPFQIAEQSQVSIDIANAIEMGPHTFQIDWVENTAHQEPKRMRAMISYSVQPVLKTDADSLLRNPLGLYVENFVFSQILS